MRFLIIDDHPIMRDAMTASLQAVDPTCDVQGVASLDEAASRLRGGSSIDLVFLDLNLPDLHGLQALEILRAKYPSLPVVVVSGSAAPDDALAAFELGAMGFIPKTSSREVFLGAFELIARGGIYVPPNLLKVLRERHAASTAPPMSTGTAINTAFVQSPARRDLRLEDLSVRQREVLQLLIHGLSNKLIGRRLKISESTVKLHVAAVLRQLGVSSRTYAVIEASRLGMRF